MNDLDTRALRQALRAPAGPGLDPGSPVDVTRIMARGRRLRRRRRLATVASCLCVAAVLAGSATAIADLTAPPAQLQPAGPGGQRPGGQQPPAPSSHGPTTIRQPSLPSGATPTPVPSPSPVTAAATPIATATSAGAAATGQPSESAPPFAVGRTTAAPQPSASDRSTVPLPSVAGAPSAVTPATQAQQ